tara:strand:+ start:243 stop:467 length:225 start_codon:yes stop_codon:yes gene_type:complete
MIKIPADKFKPHPIQQKTKDRVKELVQQLNYSDALAALKAVCEIHNRRPDAPAMDHDQIIKNLDTWYKEYEDKR